MPITVVNRKSYSGDGVYIGRSSPLGNPFSHQCHASIRDENKVETREEAVKKYSQYLEVIIVMADGIVWKELMRLVQRYRKDKELTLICWCKPEACHGDILAKEIERMASKE